MPTRNRFLKTTNTIPVQSLDPSAYRKRLNGNKHQRKLLNNDGTEKVDSIDKRIVQTER